jgi:hypothetical protein
MEFEIKDGVPIPRGVGHTLRGYEERTNNRNIYGEVQDI